MGAGATAIARNLGKEFLLNVADDVMVCHDGNGLSISVMPLHRLVIHWVDVDRFRFDGRELYGFQLRRAVEGVIGAYDDIHHEVEEIFREAQEAAAYEAQVRRELFVRMESSERSMMSRALRGWAQPKIAARIHETHSRRKDAAAKLCECGCGRSLGNVRYPGRKRFATKACIVRGVVARRSQSARKHWDEHQPRCRYCHRPVPKLGPRWYRRKFCGQQHKNRFFRERREGKREA